MNFLHNSMFKLLTVVNPLVILVSLSAFNLFNTKKFNVKFINYISSMSLIIYILHENILLREYTKADYFAFIYKTFGYEHIVIISISSSLIVFIISVIISILYKLTIQKVIVYISNKVYNNCSKIQNKIVERIDKFN